MDLFQLQRSIENLEKVAHLKCYQPFLGVVNFDVGSELIDEQLKETCIKACCDKLYFMVVNNSFSSERGEHWFFIGFEKNNANVLYSFNSYGVVSTLKTFGCPSSDTVENARKRLKALTCISKTIWGKHAVGLPNIIGINGIQQDFSTDECGYHVFRFAVFLYKNVLPKEPNESCWNRVLDCYLKKFDVTVVPYQYKYLNVEGVESILLENDRKVRRFTEEKNYIKDKSNLIQFHDEFNLTKKQWTKKAKAFKSSFQQLTNVIIKKPGSTITIIMSSIRSKKKEKIKKINQKKADFLSPYKKNVNPITGQRYVTSFDDSFEEMYKKSQTSLSREIIKSLFPTHVNNKANPLTNDMQYSGMIDDPDFLSHVFISLPGDIASMTTVGEFFKSLGIDLNPMDPYTYTLSILLKSYFENHPDKKKAEQLFIKIQKNNFNLWKYVK